jgi:hypothetical protein
MHIRAAGQVTAGPVVFSPGLSTPVVGVMFKYPPLAFLRAPQGCGWHRILRMTCSVHQSGARTGRYGAAGRLLRFLEFGGKAMPRAW